MNDSILVYVLYIKCSKHSCSINLTFYNDTLSRLTLCPQGNCHALSLSADFLSGSFLEIFLQVSNSLDPDRVDILLGRIWIQTVCKSYQQTTQVGTCDCDNSQQ